ncbi:MAG: hypothetical protein MJ093_09560 [Saccharofermentans sp.]|nr:hypothetical protein [Saccharofermentans sp.]
MNNNIYYYILITIFVVVVLAYGFTTGRAIEWLKGAVVFSERELGSGTGQLKLRIVYDMFIDKFPAFSTVVPFTLFSYWVDIALRWFKKQLETNANVKVYIEGE